MVDKLPTEVLRDIFRRSLPPRKINHRYISLSVSVSAPLYISHVCRYWREVSLSYEELWSHLVIDFSNEERKMHKIARRVFDTWLQRTRGSPLNFTFHYMCGPEAEEHDTEAYMIKTLIGQQHRWRDVDFYWLLLGFLYDFEVKLTNMPMLTSLKLSVRALQVFHTSPATVNISRSSRLRHVNLSAYFTLATGDEPIRTMTEPSELGFGRACQPRRSVLACLDLLKVAPNLTGLWVNFDLRDDDSSSYVKLEEPVETHALRSLKLGSHYASAFVIDNVTLPSLQSLDYDDDSYEEGNEMLLRFFQRSTPPLGLLDISSPHVNEEALISILFLLPTLEVLRIPYIIDSTLVFNKLTVKDAGGEGNPSSKEQVLCPKLVSLHLRYLRYPEDDDEGAEALIKMAKSRWEVFRTFGKIAIVDPKVDRELFQTPNITEDEIKDLKSCMKEGCEVIIDREEMAPYTFAMFH